MTDYGGRAVTVAEARPDTVHAAARQALAAGLCVIRAADDGTKRPHGQWKHWQATRPTEADVDAWFTGGWPGLGIVCGAVSGGLEMFELEGRAVDEGIADDFDLALAAAGHDELWGRIVAGYCETTPSGGLHVMWRCPQPDRNLKLARRPATAAELAADPDDRTKVLIETRGEGGFTIVAPSNGRTHPTGGAWRLEHGGFDTIATITAEERQAVLDIAANFDRIPASPERATPTPTPAGPGGSLPGEEFNLAHTGHDVLAAAGFHSPRHDSKGTHYTRPGKDARQGTSATVWADDGTITLFSTSIAAPAEYIGDRRLNPWRAHVALAHSGDHSAAASAWRARHPRERPPVDDLSSAHTGRGAGSASDQSDTDLHDAEPTPLTLTPASTVGIDRPYWIWEDRIPVGGTTLMPGREGMGKTALMCWAMARLTRGQLPGDRFGKPAHVVYVGHEDDRASVLVPRLTATGADLDRVLFVDMPEGASFSVGVDTVALRHALAGLDVALVVIDPLDGHLVGVDTHRKAEVQQSIMKLAVLAQDVRCGAIGLAHLNKGEVRDILARVNGSVGFTTTVRSVLGVGEHPEDPAERVCVVAKANMTDKTKVPAIRFRVEGASVPHPDGGDPIDTGVVVMLGEQEGIDPNSVIDSGTPAERSALEAAVDWLNDVLADGPQSSKDVKAWARDADISDRTLKRALSRAGVEVSRLNTERGRPTVWALRGFRANGFGPNPLGPKDTPTVTREDTADARGFGPTPGNGPKPDDDPSPSVADPLAADPLDEEF